MISIVHSLLALLLAPLLPGVINRTKALVAGRDGPPVVQPYYELGRLLRKGAVYSGTAGWVFRAGPVVALAAVALALLLVPFAGAPAPVAFEGDLILLAGLLALARFFTALAALDTGSAFEGMGASREVLYGALAEPALLAALATLGRATDRYALSAMLARVSPALWSAAGAALALLAVALFIVLLAENARIPFDDPNTHLELTMIHEAMVLDHGGPDLALIQYGAALKLWLFAALVAGLVFPVAGAPWLRALAALGGIWLVGLAVGLVESCMARLRLVRVPQILVAAAVLAVLAFMLQVR